MTRAAAPRCVRAAALLAVAVLVGACTSADDGDGGDGATPTSSSAATPGTVDAAQRIDWRGGATDLALPNGWRATPCDAGPTRLCVRDGQTTLGVVELNDHPLVSFPRVRDVLRDGGSFDEALRAEAASFSATFTADRAEGCGPGYAVEPRPPVAATVGGKPGLSFGFDASLDGATVERVVQLATIVDESIFVVSMTSVAPGSCIDDPDLDEFAPDQLVAIEPAITTAVAASPLPDPTNCVNPSTGAIDAC